MPTTQSYCIYHYIHSEPEDFRDIYYYYFDSMDVFDPPGVTKYAIYTMLINPNPNYFVQSLILLYILEHSKDETEISII